MKKLFAWVLALALLLSVGTAFAEEQGKVLNIYCWNTEFKDRFEYFKASELYDEGITVNFIITPNEGGAYQKALDEALLAQEGAAADDRVDIFLVEANYALKYVNTDYTLDVIKDVGLTAEDIAGQYAYTQEIVTNDLGAIKGVTWQATPGLFAYRRSIAKDVLGTDDPAAVQEALKDWASFDAVAEQAAAKGYKMLSGYDDAYRVFANNISAPLVQDGKIVIDQKLFDWVEQTKNYTDKGWNNKTSLWAPEWSADQGPDGKVFGFFYSTWGINFTLLGNSLADPNAAKEVGNGIFGDYAVCEGPASWYWGGTWICAAAGTDNIDYIRDVMYVMSCDKDTLKQITLDTQDYTNTVAGMQEIADDPSYGAAFLGGQNHVALFAKSAANIDMSNTSAYDQLITETFQRCMKDYFDGNVPSVEAAYENFQTEILEIYPDLSF